MPDSKKQKQKKKKKQNLLEQLMSMDVEILFSLEEREVFETARFANKKPQEKTRRKKQKIKKLEDIVDSEKEIGNAISQAQETGYRVGFDEPLDNFYKTQAYFRWVKSQPFYAEPVSTSSAPDFSYLGNQKPNDEMRNEYTMEAQMQRVEAMDATIEMEKVRNLITEKKKEDIRNGGTSVNYKIASDYDSFLAWKNFNGGLNVIYYAFAFII